jgi:hypothetical protein
MVTALFYRDLSGIKMLEKDMFVSEIDKMYDVI